LYTTEFEKSEDYSDKDVVQLLKLGEIFVPEDELDFIYKQLLPPCKMTLNNLLNYQKLTETLIIIPKLSKIVEDCLQGYVHIC
jgi:hypothetical protein